MMRDDQHRFLTLRQLPARLTAEQVGWLVNCQPHDVPILVTAKVLKPLGNPPPNCVKFFATLEVLELAKDRAWLAKLTNTLTQHWQDKNRRKKRRPAAVAGNGHELPLNLPVLRSDQPARERQPAVE